MRHEDTCSRGVARDLRNKGYLAGLSRRPTVAGPRRHWQTCDRSSNMSINADIVGICRIASRPLLIGSFINRFFPLKSPPRLAQTSISEAANAAARALVPWGIRRWGNDVLLARRIRALPDRRYFREQIVPWLAAAGARNVLEVGCRRYTRDHARLFAGHGMTLWTCDIDPAAARFGAKGRHRTVDVCRMRADTFPLVFDAVCLNGVIGFGVDQPAQIVAAVVAISAILQPGAHVVVGWNTDRSIDPLTLPGVARRLVSVEGGRVPSRVTFDGVTHVFDCLAVASATR